ncbi:TPA: hypothetical protein DCE37_26775 [Candidatus Latescibacteria bacterium]|nr:hypothetical protein [Candidatus Latescibacterota bacterium]
MYRRRAIRRRQRDRRPLGIASADGLLYIADTYNYRIKTYSLETAEVHTIARTGTPGNTDGKTLDASFNEPSGLAIYGDKLYIADTNNHAIRVMSLDTDIISTLDVR